MKLFVTLNLIFGSTLLMGCGDFFNSSKSAPALTAPRSEPGRLEINPLPKELEKPNEGPFSEQKMLVNIGINVIAKAAAEFAIEAAVLNRRVGELCQVSKARDEDRKLPPEKLLEVRSQWKRAMLAYHFLDSAPVGPLSANDEALSNQIYAWPLFNSCGIDVETLKLYDGLGTQVADQPFPVRGLGAIEYLLFESTLESKCNARAFPQIAAWVVKPAEQKQFDRCRLAAALSKDVLDKANAVVREWDPQGRNYAKSFVDGTSPQMKTVKEATNLVTDSLFQIETVKDVRLGRPLGRHRDCVSSTGKCPESIEHPFSGEALAAIQARLRGFEAVFFGIFKDDSQSLKEGFGFDDFLVARGHADIGEKMRRSVKDSLSSVKTIESKENRLSKLIENLNTTACAESTKTNRKVEVCGLFQDVREVSTILKAEVMAVLALRAPPTYQGDND